jgi:hypothetical protein
VDLNTVNDMLKTLPGLVMVLGEHEWASEVKPVVPV